MTQNKDSNSTIIKLFDGYLDFDTNMTANQLFYDLNLRGFKFEPMFESAFVILKKPNSKYDYVVTFNDTKPESKPIMIQKGDDKHNWMMGKKSLEIIWENFPLHDSGSVK